MKETAEEIRQLKKELIEAQTFLVVLIAASPDETITIPSAAINQALVLGVTDINVDKLPDNAGFKLTLERQQPQDSTILHLP